MSDYDDYNYDDYQYEMDNNMEQEDDETIEIENLYNQAEDNVKYNKESALSDFKQVVQKESQKPNEEKKRSFLALKYLIILSIQLKKNYEMLDGYLVQILNLMQYQYKSDQIETLNQLVEILITSNEDSINNILIQLLGKLKEMNFISLYCSSSLKLCKYYEYKNDYESLNQMIADITSMLQKNDQSIDSEKFKQLQTELNAYKIVYLTKTKQHQKIKPIYRELLKINFNLYEPNIVGILNQVIGQYKAIERQYESSRKYLMNSFYSFQDGGNHVQAKLSLIYASVVSILENFRMNIFDDMRSKAYDGDIQMEQFKQLRKAYEKQNVNLFSELIYNEIITKDLFLAQLQPYLSQIIIEQKIMRYSKCYTKITIKYLSEVLLMKPEQVLSQLQVLLAKKCFMGKINEVEQYLEFEKEDNYSQTQSLKIMIDQINVPDL